MNELTYINQLPETKNEIELFSQRVIDIVNNGNANPLEVTIRLKAIEETIKKIRKGIEDSALDEAMKYGKSTEIRNAKIDIAQVGVRYDFSNCCDPVWEDADVNENFAKQSKKEREDFLKTLKSSITIVDERNGEIVTVNPPVKTGKESIKITLK